LGCGAGGANEDCHHIPPFVAGNLDSSNALNVMQYIPSSIAAYHAFMPATALELLSVLAML
jgi:hypothetical protein